MFRALVRRPLIAKVKKILDDLLATRIAQASCVAVTIIAAPAHKDPAGERF
jgi:hypothetical protein